MISDEFLDELSKQAKKAIKGQWYPVGLWVETDRDDLPDPVQNPLDTSEPEKNTKLMEETVKYIALAQPQNILAMVQEIRRLRG